MNRNYGAFGLQFGLVLAALVVIGIFTGVLGLAFGMAAEAPPPGDPPPEPDPGGNALMIAGMVLGVVGLTHVVVLPISMYIDTKYVRQTTGWRPLRILWIPLSAVPLVQLPVTIVYLLRRTYLLTLRPRLTGQRPDTDSQAMTATATSEPVASGTASAQTGQSPPSVAQRVVSSLKTVGKIASYILLSYVLGIGIALGISTLLGLNDAVSALLGLVLWVGSYWVLR